jgi:predicted GIY-YIG superfamily endonuclease
MVRVQLPPAPAWTASALSFGSASQPKSPRLPAMNFSYVYILQSVSEPDRFYIGLTDDLQERLRKHNAGEVAHTAKFKPWAIKTAIAFRDRDRAAEFERYLKSGSGRAFARKHF